MQYSLLWISFFIAILSNNSNQIKPFVTHKDNSKSLLLASLGPIIRKTPRVWKLWKEKNTLRLKRVWSMIFLAPFAKSRMLLYLGLVHLGYISVGPFFRTFLLLLLFLMWCYFWGELSVTCGKNSLTSSVSGLQVVQWTKSYPCQESSGKETNVRPITILWLVESLEKWALQSLSNDNLEIKRICFKLIHIYKSSNV